MRRLIWLPIAGFLLIAGAAIAAAATAPSAVPVAGAILDASSPAPSPASSPATGTSQESAGQPLYPGNGKGVFGLGADLLDQVLADLVKAGTITQAQSDAITQGLQQAITDRQDQAQQLHQQMQQQWQQIQGFLSDGVITQDEVDQLPANSPFRQVFDSIAKNGQVTLDQIQQLRMLGPGMAGPQMMNPGMGPGRGHGWGAPGWSDQDDDQGQNPQASPSTTGASS